MTTSVLITLIICVTILAVVIIDTMRDVKKENRKPKSFPVPGEDEAISDDISIKDMREEIENHCKENDGCRVCALKGKSRCYMGATDEEIKTNYNIIKKEI